MMNGSQNDHSYGAYELRRNSGRYLALAFVISLAIHAIVIVAFMLRGTDDVQGPAVTLAPLARPRTDTTYVAITLINDPKPGHQGGGAPDVTAPAARSSKGHPEATPDRSHNARDPHRTAVPNTPTNVKPVRDPKPPLVAGDKNDTSKKTGVTGTRGQDVNGEGSHPSSGSGGAGVGVGSASGMGSRGWQVRPRATYPSGSGATGTVMLRFTVLPNGDITNITPVKRADQALVDAAMSGLRRAKARALPADVPQVPQIAQIPFTFVLR